MWSQKFAAGVTKLLAPDEIRRFDGTVEYLTIPHRVVYNSMKKNTAIAT
jgi:hypothetical protein